MLFNEFVLHNFGIYRGRHSVDLNPEHKRPVILFGALNGSGKTTFLDGLQLALYGKQARCTGRGNMAYTEFLRSCINRYIPPSEGAGLELEFCHHTEGRWQTVRVCRSWTVRGASVKEKLEVLRDGVLDTVLSEHWAEYVEDFIPSQISELFFFDGEKIEGLAEEKSASAIIRTGIHALLGLDVVDRLSADLKVLQRRRRAELLDEEAKARVAEKYKALEEASQQQQLLTQLMAHEQDQVDGFEKGLAELREQYRLAGGELAEQAGEQEKMLRVLEDEKARHDARLVEIAAGAAPLLLVRDLLNAARTQAEAEEQARKSKLMLEELNQRDLATLSLLRKATNEANVVNQVEAYLKTDRQQRATQGDHPIYLNVPAATFAPYSNERLDAMEQEIARELEISKDIKARIDHVERLLAGMPSLESLEPLKLAMASQTEQLQQAKGRLAYIQEQLDEVVRRTERLEKEYQFILEQEAQTLSQSETNQRVIAHISKTEDTLKKYRQVILAKNLQRLGVMIMESFQRIIRKKAIFTRIEISAQDYTLSLYDRENNHIPTHQLSAGERQLLAVSILWGLSQAAGRPLPAIIDTPLGRLDGPHRNLLVSNYFPAASHQVILLSTDEEIDGLLYKKLERSIAKDYVIEFDDTSMRSEIKSGYFGFMENA